MAAHRVRHCGDGIGIGATATAHNIHHAFFDVARNPFGHHFGSFVVAAKLVGQTGVGVRAYKTVDAFSSINLDPSLYALNSLISSAVYKSAIREGLELINFG